MPERIVVQCQGCSKRFGVPESTAGKKIRCPSCKGVIAVGGGASSSEPVSVARSSSGRSPGSGSSGSRRSTAQSSSARKASPRNAAGREPSSSKKRTGREAETRRSPAANAQRKKTPRSKPEVQKKKQRRPRQAEPVADEFDDVGLYDDIGDDTWGEPDPYASLQSLPARRKKKKKSAKPKLAGTGNEPPPTRKGDPTYSSFGDRMVNGGVLAGLGMMAGAAVWFVVGLSAGYIFFYPPVLFILGLASFFKGLVGD